MKIKNTSEIEFIGIIASLMALSALSIDALLPALNDITHSLKISKSENNQLLVTMIFLGQGFGQLISGPISDNWGRKKTIYIGYLIFSIASVVCIYASNLGILLIGRLFQGIGLSAPRSISIAIVRDRFSGNQMAKIVSFVTSIFILVPIIAPSFGKFIMHILGWKSIFVSQIIFGFLIMMWMWKRLPETLNNKHKRKLKLSLFVTGFKEFSKQKQSILFTLLLGFMTMAYMLYISVCQHIYQNQYNLIDEFPFIFAALSITYGISTFINGKLVIRFGMIKITTTATISFLFISLSYVLLFYNKSNPQVFIFITYISLIWFVMGFIFGNTNAMAMQPIGHIAGIGSAIIGFISTVIVSVPLASYIGQFVNNTAMPIFINFTTCGILSLLLIVYYKISLKNKKHSTNNKLQLHTILISTKNRKNK